MSYNHCQKVQTPNLTCSWQFEQNKCKKIFFLLFLIISFTYSVLLKDLGFQNIYQDWA